MVNKEPKIKPQHIHRIMKYLSPKRVKTSSKKGTRDIPRSVTPKGLDIATSFINKQLEDFVLACELALEESNMNPNTYYKKFRYDEDIIKRAIKIMKNREMDKNI